MAVPSGHYCRGFGHWALEDSETGELVGRAGLYYPPDWPGSEVGWTVAREHWGKGYAPEAPGGVRLGVREARDPAHPEPDPPGQPQLDPRGGEARRRLEGEHSTRGFDLLVYGTGPALDRPSA